MVGGPFLAVLARVVKIHIGEEGEAPQAPPKESAFALFSVLRYQEYINYF